MDTARILIIDDDPGVRKTLADILRVKRYDILTAGSGAEGLSLLEEHPTNLVLIDLGLPDMPGIEVLDRVRTLYPTMEAIILTGNATLDSAIEATNRGALPICLSPTKSSICCSRSNARSIRSRPGKKSPMTVFGCKK